jgi:pimeloyl-ACP methyl ester carboxylesterase
MTTVLVHGMPETAQIWDPLRAVLGRKSMALELPGFGSPRPAGFTSTKDAYAQWLGDTLTDFPGPIDVVGHDLGALLAMRVASSLHVPVRSWVVDVANIFHPDFVWPERVHRLQTPGVGEEMMRTAREAAPNDPASTSARLEGHGVPSDLARMIGARHDDVMSQSILDFYRSAVPNVGTGWWRDIKGPTGGRGLVLLLPDPPEAEAMSLEVASRLGADTARLDGLNHCWMAQAPDVVAAVLERFWASFQ